MSRLSRVAVGRVAVTLIVLAIFSLPDARAAEEPDVDPVAVLKQAMADGTAVAELSVAKRPLSRAEAEAARDLMWQAHADRIRRERAEELAGDVVRLGTVAMPYKVREFGTRPESGWSLWISLHGGGGAPAAVNDQQWRNQVRLYSLEEGLYVAPRAPTNTWNLWHQEDIDKLLARLIETFVAARGVDPDRVYVLGYSAGGDGVYQLAPRMAGRWAAAGMMAGHPNDASPLGLRNLPFALQVGGRDTAYQRNEVAARWARQLDELQKSDPEGYTHFVRIYEQYGHWMNGEDRVALPWMARFRRNPVPRRVVWKQSPVVHRHFYWLSVPDESARAGSLVRTEIEGQTITIRTADQVDRLGLWLDDRLMDLDQPIEVRFQDQKLFQGTLPRTLETLDQSLRDRGDPRLQFSARFDVDLASLRASARSPVTAVALTPDGRQVIAGSQRGLEVYLWPELKLEGTLPTDLENIHDVEFSPDGQRLLVAGGTPAESGQVELLQWPDRQRVAQWTPHKDLVVSVRWRPGNDGWLTASADGTCGVYTAAGEATGTFTGHSRPVLDVELLNAETAVSVGIDQTLKVWNVATGQLIRTLDNHTESVTAVAVRPAGTDGAAPMCATISEDRTVRIWQPVTGRMVRFARLPSIPSALAWSADGHRLIVGCRDGNIVVLDPATAAIMSSTDGGVGRILEIRRDNRGKRLLIAGERGLAVQAGPATDAGTP